MILAAGYGTRLLPLTTRKSKVTLPLAGVPVLVRILRTFRSLGVHEFIVNLHHADDTVRACLARAGEKVVFSFEREILGTGGALFKAKEFLDEGTFLLVNGDCYYSGFPLDQALEFHKSRNSLATMMLIDMPQGEKYRGVEIDSEGRLCRIAGLPEVPGHATAPGLHFPGLHLLEPELLEEIHPGFSDINRDIYPALIARGAPVYGFHTKFQWLDLGTPKHYLEASHKLLLSSEYPERGAPILMGENCTVHHSALLEAPLEIGSEARIGPGCSVRGSVLGDSVILESDVFVEQSIIGDNVHLKAGSQLSRCSAVDLDGVLEIRQWE